MKRLSRAVYYFGDPLCSWCYGFSPVILALKREFESKIPFLCILGGLRPGPQAEKLDDRLKKFLSQHWHHIHEATGQPFSYDLFKRDDFVYDTEPASRAVVIARRLLPDRTFEYFSTLQTAFYAESRDLTRPEVLCDVFETFGGDPNHFMVLWNDESVRQETLEDFQFSAASGIRGFPSLVLVNEGKGLLLSHGYTDYQTLKERVEVALQ